MGSLGASFPCMGNRNHSLLLQHSIRPKAGVNVALLPTQLKTFLKPRKTLPSFSGSTKEALIEDWLQECEKTAAILRWTDRIMLEKFPKKLSGDARKFHEKILKSVKDYEDWRKLMTDKFFEKDKEFYARQLIDLKQKPDQSVRAFAQEIDSLMVKTLGLAIITDKLYKTFCLNTKLAYFSDGLREDVWARFGSVLLKNQGRLPFWSRIVEEAQDAEWLIDLRNKSAYSKTANTPQWPIEDYTKVYITISWKKEKNLTGYGVFFGNDDSKSISDVSACTCNATLIIAATRAINAAKNCGMERLVIYTSSEYLLKFVDQWAVPWLERKWRNVSNVNLWRELLTSLEGNINVKWEIPNKKGHGYTEAIKLAKIALSK